MEERTDPAAMLSEKEKEALRLWLDRATAKEIAIDLGISHHAVEKRLKSARAKLDVSSSLAAARLLAEAENAERQGYQRTASQSPDLSSTDHNRKQQGSSAAARAGTLGQVIRRRPLVSGVIAMSLILAAGVALSMAAQSTGVDTSSTPPAKRVVLTRVGDANAPQDPRASFDKMDADGSGFVEQAEIDTMKVVSFTAGENGLERSEPRADLITIFDTNGDGRISFAEFEQVVSGKS